MKKLLFIAAVIFMATAVYSFSKEEFEKDNTDKTDVKLVRQIKWNSNIVDLEYDSYNRIVRYYEYNAKFRPFIEWNFIYDEDSMVAYNDSGEVYNCKLNKDGYITEWVDGDDKEIFTYKNGYMVYSDYIFSHSTSNGSFRYQWENGNITYIFEDPYDNCYFSYSPYKYPHINLDLLYIQDLCCYPNVLGLLGFYGRHNDYLPAIVTYNGDSSVNYVYAFNEDGMVSKIIFGETTIMELYY